MAHILLPAHQVRYVVANACEDIHDGGYCSSKSWTACKERAGVIQQS